MRKRILTPVILSLSLLAASPALASETPQEARRCDRAIELARQVGWLKKDLPYLRYILWRESRCQPDSIGRNRDTTGRVTSEDLGYAQINDRSWVTYLKNQGIIQQREDLLKPKTNLKAALELLRYSVRHGYDRWHQWRGTSGK
jgi:hypothetical protein